VGLLGLAAVAWAVSWRWDAPAAVLLALVGNALGVLSALAYQPLVGMLIAAAFLLPAAGLWLAWRHGRTRAAVAGVTVVLCAGTWAGASVAYAHFFGPAHPESTVAVLPVDRVVWTWSGGVTGTSATVVAELARGRRTARLVLRPDAGGAEVTTDALPAGPGRVVRLTATGLRPDTPYAYVLNVDGSPDRGRGVGRLRTVPTGPASFTVALGSCARTGSNGSVFDAIAALHPLLYVQTGDLHYGNPAAADPALFDTLYRRVLTAPAQAALYRSVPVAYVWDDHDYGPNDADSTAPTRVVARAAYRSHVPHHPLPAGDDGAIYQAFNAGRVRFVLTDTRSERTATTMLGAPQLEWLENELVTSARTHALVVWVNPDPWIAAPNPAADNWGAYPAERRRLADVIAGAGIRNLVMVSGDAHMAAIDDGSHTGYSATGFRGFPLLHAAALDRPGNVKGGPYSEGAFPGAGHFGALAVSDAGGPTVDVQLAGRNWRGETLVTYRTTIAVPA
jgi:phosphodiesterase/alkaline phosphatase D-like protein